MDCPLGRTLVLMIVSPHLGDDALRAHLSHGAVPPIGTPEEPDQDREHLVVDPASVQFVEDPEWDVDVLTHSALPCLRR